MNQFVQFYYKEALNWKLDTHYFTENDCLEICLGNKNYHFIDRFTPLNIGTSIILSKNKPCAQFLLKENHYNIPASVLINREWLAKSGLFNLVNGLNQPLVIKPALDSLDNIDILCNISSFEELSKYVDKFLEKEKVLKIEEFHPHLREYTVLILNKKVIGVVEHFPPYVVGDGVQTVKQLIVSQNEQRLSCNRAVIPIDEECIHCLKGQNLSLDAVPIKDQNVTLSYAANKARGAYIVSHGNTLHPQNAKTLIEASDMFNLNWMSFDILCEDINQPFNVMKWFIIEVHNNPDISLYEMPDEGVKIRVSEKILKLLISRHPFSYLWHRLTRKKRT